ncbi:MAG: hypothetical protein LCH96_10135 [Actinobacteria bacterium]|nr:hypothetical protein [Actinomycetota bacterium]
MSDGVSEYGLGSPDTQVGDDVGSAVEAEKAESREQALAHGLGPSEGPFEGESASEDEGTRFGLGSENTQDADVAEPAADPGDGLEHGLES